MNRLPTELLIKIFLQLPAATLPWDRHSATVMRSPLLRADRLNKIHRNVTFPDLDDPDIAQIIRFLCMLRPQHAPYLYIQCQEVDRMDLCSNIVDTLLARSAKARKRDVEQELYPLIHAETETQQLLFRRMTFEGQHDPFAPIYRSQVNPDLHVPRSYFWHACVEGRVKSAYACFHPSLQAHLHPLDVCDVAAAICSGDVQLLKLVITLLPEPSIKLTRNQLSEAIRACNDWGSIEMIKFLAHERLIDIDLSACIERPLHLRDLLAITRDDELRDLNLWQNEYLLYSFACAYIFDVGCPERRCTRAEFLEMSHRMNFDLNMFQDSLRRKLGSFHRYNTQFDVGSAVQELLLCGFRPAYIPLELVGSLLLVARYGGRNDVSSTQLDDWIQEIAQHNHTSDASQTTISYF